MGAKCSSLSSLNSNEHLLKLCGSTPLSVNDPSWNQLFSFSLQIPLTSKESRAVLEETCDLFKLIRKNNAITRNVGSLLKAFLIRAVELKASAQCDDKIFIWQTCNALFLLRILLTHWVEYEKETELIKQFTWKNEENSESLLDSLAVQAVEILVDVPLREETALLHMECIHVLLLLLFIAASSYMANNRSVLLRCLMMGRGALHAGLLVRTLLRHFCQEQPVPLHWLKKTKLGGSVVIGLASGLWEFISGNNSSSTDTTTSEFASQSLLLLLVLTNHCCSEKTWNNPYRQALLSFTDSLDPVQVSPVHPAACFRLDYSLLYSTICDHLSDERTTLLLYLLLHQHQQFRNYVYTHAEIQRLVIALLSVLYSRNSQGSHHLYMSLIILLLLSEDEGFNCNIHNIIIRNPLWYTERVLNEISLGGLIVLVIVRTIQQNIVKTGDKYLHTNCLATLANMAAHFRRLHSYVCQRLVSLLCLLNKRRMRVIQQLKNNPTIEMDDVKHKEILEQDLNTLEEVLRMLLEIINAALTYQLSSSPHLVYSILYQKEVLDALRLQAPFQDIIANLDTVSSYFTAKINQISEPGVAEILGAIQNGSLDFPKDQLKKFPELKFRYVEEEQPEEFFVPYVWSLVHSTSTSFWNRELLCGLENGNYS